MKIQNERKGAKMKEVICTIHSNNYIAYGKVLSKSFLRQHPRGKVFILLVDKKLSQGKYPDEEDSRIKIITAEELKIKNFESLVAKYNITELNTAVKPYFLYHLFNSGIEKLIYLDPDILILKPLTKIFNLLEKYEIVLIPHITKPIKEDRKKPDDITILRAGTFNLGFLGLRYTKNTKNFLEWWKEKCYKDCWLAPLEGFHVDQKWLDFVPSFYENFYILREPAYNVAYWNLHERKIKRKGKEFFVNDKPLVFFHFSKMDMNLQKVSIYQDRFVLKGDLKSLFQFYKNLLLKNGYEETKDLPCAYKNIKNIKKVDCSDIDPNIRAERQISSHRPWPINKILVKSRKFLHEEIMRAIDSILQKQIAFNKQVLEIIRKKDFTTVDEHLKFLRSFHKSGPEKFGINVLADIGKDSKEVGTNIAAKNMIMSFKTKKIPLALAELGNMSIEKPLPIFPINYIHANADSVLLDIYPKFEGYFQYFQNKYNIGCWTWELSNFPEKWKDAFRHFDEIWVPSNFVRESISKISPVPVIKINYPILIEEIKDGAKRYSRRDFGIKKDAFVFLFAFDYLSYFERKNPLAIVEAFKKAFKNLNFKNVWLIIKTSRSEFDKKNAKKLEKAARGLPITIINEEMPREKFFGLLNACDCFVSLHRSEGFGLIIAEAMALGKPVIVTGYSGNMDFTNSENSFLVNYRLKKIKKDVGPYEAGNVWAEPSVKHAAKLMRYVLENRKEAMEVGRKAALYIKKELCPEKIGKKAKERLKIIYQNLKKFK